MAKTPEIPHGPQPEGAPGRDGQGEPSTPRDASAHFRGEVSRVFPPDRTPIIGIDPKTNKVVAVQSVFPMREELRVSAHLEAISQESGLQPQQEQPFIVSLVEAWDTPKRTTTRTVLFDHGETPPMTAEDALGNARLLLTLQDEFESVNVGETDWDSSAMTDPVEHDPSEKEPYDKRVKRAIGTFLERVRKEVTENNIESVRERVTRHIEGLKHELEQEKRDLMGEYYSKHAIYRDPTEGEETLARVYADAMLKYKMHLLEIDDASTTDEMAVEYYIATVEDDAYVKRRMEKYEKMRAKLRSQDDASEGPAGASS